MSLSLFSKSHSSLSARAKRLVAMRFLIYTGFQTSYFIGVIGTLTYADGASVVATSLAVLFMNVFVILGSFAGGAALDAWGPRHHFLLSIVGTLATGAAIIAFGSATGTVLAGAALLGFVMGFAQPIATSYPAYLTDDPVELKDINSTITMFSNVSIIVGPTLGGFVAAASSSRAVFVLMMLFTPACAHCRLGVQAAGGFHRWTCRCRFGGGGEACWPKPQPQHVRPRHLRDQHQDGLHQQRPRPALLHHLPFELWLRRLRSAGVVLLSRRPARRRRMDGLAFVGLRRGRGAGRRGRASHAAALRQP